MSGDILIVIIGHIVKIHLSLHSTVRERIEIKLLMRLVVFQIRLINMFTLLSKNAFPVNFVPLVAKISMALIVRSLTCSSSNFLHLIGQTFRNQLEWLVRRVIDISIHCAHFSWSLVHWFLIEINRFASSTFLMASTTIFTFKSARR